MDIVSYLIGRKDGEKHVVLEGCTASDSDSDGNVVITEEEENNG